MHSLLLDDNGRQQDILSYDDHPSLLHSDTAGVLRIDESAIGRLNVESTFFVTVAIAYLGYLEDKEARPGSLACMSLAD